MEPQDMGHSVPAIAPAGVETKGDGKQAGQGDGILGEGIDLDGGFTVFERGVEESDLNWSSVVKVKVFVLADVHAG